jgi:phage repressor protein C with HTH and peptisase S24 domain
MFVFDGSTYCKELYVNYVKKRIELHSINPKYRPIIITEDNADDWRTVGKILL